MQMGYVFDFHSITPQSHELPKIKGDFTMRKILNITLILGVLIFAVSADSQSLEDVEFSGQYRLRSTINNTWANDYDPNLQTSDTINWMDMRIRLRSQFQFTHDIDMVTNFEIKNVTFGDPASGGGPGTDGRHNLVVKHAYLDVRNPAIPARIQLGLVPVYDHCHGIMFDDDAAGIKIHPNAIQGLTLTWLMYDEYKDVPQRSDDDASIYLANYSREVNDDIHFDLGTMYFLDRAYRYKENDQDEGTPTWELYVHGRGDVRLGNFFMDGVVVYNSGYDTRDRNHTGYAVSLKPQLSVGNLTLDGTFLLVSASDDEEGVDLEDPTKPSFDRKFAKDVDYFKTFRGSYWYESGLELLSFGVNDAATIDEITMDLSLFGYGSITYVGRATYDVSDKMSVWATAGLMSRMAQKYKDYGDGLELKRQTVASEVDLGIELNFTDQMQYRLVGAMVTPHEDYFGEDNETVYGFNTAFTFIFGDYAGRTYK